MQGRLLRVDGSGILLQTDYDKTAFLPSNRVQKVEVRTGSYWLTGLLVGATIDLVLVLVVVPRVYVANAGAIR